MPYFYQSLLSSRENSADFVVKLSFLQSCGSKIKFFGFEAEAF